LVYTLFFSPGISTLSRLCAVLATYKRAFESAVTQPASPSAGDSPAEAYPKEYVSHFNGFLMDVCNCLWRSRAFNTGDVNALGCLLPAEVGGRLAAYVAGLDTGLQLSSLFNLSYSPVLALQSITYLRELEDKADEERGLSARHAGPVTQKSLLQLGRDGGVEMAWAAYRLGVLRYLEDAGVGGVSELMYNTMRHLMAQREAQIAAKSG
jgi:centromere protein I